MFDCFPTGAAVLCCERRRSDLRCLTAAPRQSVHEALSAPHKYMGISAQMGMSAESEDACIAYQLFLEVGLVAVWAAISLHAKDP